MIALYGLGSVWDLPEQSPFVTKVDCYLRMVGLPYKLALWQSPEDLANTSRSEWK